MKKLAVGIIATIAGLLIVAAMLACLLGVIYAVSYSINWLLLLTAPVPLGVAARLLMKWVDELIGFND